MNDVNMEQELFSIFDEANGILYDRHIFHSKQEASAYAAMKNSIPPVKRLLPRPRPHFVAVKVAYDGLREELVGFSKAYKIIED